jgi:fructosamine-3-kinase
MTFQPAQIEAALGVRAQAVQPLHGGMIAQVCQVDLVDGRRVVAKAAKAAALMTDLRIEAYMLRTLRQRSTLPVPEVLYSDAQLLVMTFIAGDSHFGPVEQRHAARLLADLHSITQPQFGLEQDTLIGALHQPNPFTDSWVEFFREQRLLHMARAAYDEHKLPSAYLARIEQLAARLENWLTEPEQPALIHGDLWTTNMLAHNGRMTGFVDPAIYYAHPEIELAYTTLFGTFQAPFFEAYHQYRPIAAGFFEERCDLYNLYPLLVHVRLFGGHYVQAVDSILRKYGF